MRAVRIWVYRIRARKAVPLVEGRTVLPSPGTLLLVLDEEEPVDAVAAAAAAAEAVMVLCCCVVMAGW